MASKRDTRVPHYTKLLLPTFHALKELGGSGSNDEICRQVIKDLNIPDEVADISHLGSTNQSDLQYQLAWARTYLKTFGAIENSRSAVWAITTDYAGAETIDEKEVLDAMKQYRAERKGKKDPKQIDPDMEETENDETGYPEGAESWRVRLAKVLQNMDPFGFERLSQRLLRECGFTQVSVTKKTGDGGIDGVGKLKINGIFSFNVAFQCKRYSGLVGAPAVRDFRGSLTTDIEKGVLITTGSFSQAAREEASVPGKKQIDLMDGEEFISKIAEYGIGVREVKTYEIDEAFFRKI